LLTFFFAREAETQARRHIGTKARRGRKRRNAEMGRESRNTESRKQKQATSASGRLLSGGGGGPSALAYGLC